jgi:methionyl-tRNA synthetase
MKILPEFRKKEILKLLDDSPDVSISRPKKNLSWGIPVPDNDNQVMYVWIDALANYITVLGYPEEDISNYWPAVIQFVGKDILRFHAIIWPAILLALDLPLPKTILSHGHVLVNGQKMSKTIGNVINPLDILNKYGVDPFRYFFLRHIDTFEDSDFTWDRFDDAYNNELANDLGNLVQRLAVLSSKNSISLSQHLIDETKAATIEDQEYVNLMNSCKFSKALDYAWQKIKSLNKEINDRQPWAVAKTDPENAKQILLDLDYKLLEANSLLAPFLPETVSKISNVFGTEIGPGSPLFPKQ